jgi:hypothetical protein
VPVEQHLLLNNLQVLADLLLLLQVHQQLLQRVVAAVDQEELVHQYLFHIFNGQENQVVQAVELQDINHLLNQEL